LFLLLPKLPVPLPIVVDEEEACDGDDDVVVVELNPNF